MRKKPFCIKSLVEQWFSSTFSQESHNNKKDIEIHLNFTFKFCAKSDGAAYLYSRAA